jgi:hypothetical protein
LESALQALHGGGFFGFSHGFSGFASQTISSYIEITDASIRCQRSELGLGTAGASLPKIGVGVRLSGWVWG